MSNKALVLLLFFLLMLINTTSASTKEITIQQSCSKDAYYNSFIKLEENGKTHIAIQSSQIVINTSVKNDNGTIKFFFNSTRDLGRGGININWDSISKSKEVLTLKTSEDNEENEYKIIWHGLYDNKAQTSILRSLFQIGNQAFKACELNDIGEWQNYLKKVQFIPTNNSTPPKFKNFPIQEKYKGKNQNLVLNEFGQQFRLRLNKVIDENKPVFAGKYLIARWRCGSGGCNSGAVIDASTGEAFEFPVTMSNVWPVKTEFVGEDTQELIYKLDSRLIIFAGNIEGKKTYFDSVLFYEFTGSSFRLLKVLPYGKSVKVPEVNNNPQNKIKNATKLEESKKQSLDHPKTTRPEDKREASGTSSLFLIASLLSIFVYKSS